MSSIDKAEKEKMWRKELEDCRLCEWKCGINRSEAVGVCNVKMPEVAYTCLAQTLKSYSITLLGCNFRCLYCNAYRLSQYPDTNWYYRGYVTPKELSKEAVAKLRAAGLEKLGFTGGEPTIHLPYIEEVVKEARKLMPELKVGFTTNGFATKESMTRIVSICSYIALEINAFNNDTHLALSGAPVEPVLRNAEYLIKNKAKVRALKTVVIPKINDTEIEEIAEFIASFDASIPYHLIGFRPSFMLYYHPGPSRTELEELGRRCERHLENVTWGGESPNQLELDGSGATLAMNYAELAGCVSKDRNCGRCSMNKSCPAILKEPWLNKPKRDLK
ncbi:MAG: 7-carboxy-7-deazaguanine synthase [Candidatus Methanophagaceae archaeon]|nr:MAG: 7-carboxy-7-deazaguanine synthase [Methanophagales archaeon]